MPSSCTHESPTESTSSGAPSNILTRFVGRQPILDAKRGVHGYELLFRSGTVNAFDGDREAATQQTLDNAILFGMDTLAPHAKAFVNCTRAALVGRMVTLLPPQVTVLEILETVEVDDEVLDACQDLKKMGYKIALDDFLPDQSSDRLLPIADYIKVDLRAMDQDAFHRVTQQLSSSKISLLAEKVETEEEFKRTAALNYQYFQGYFFSKPVICSTRQIPPNQLVYMQILSAISQSPYDVNLVQSLLMREASLSYRLLCYANSAQGGARGHVTSLTQALMMVGEDQFRRLATVCIAVSMGKGSDVAYELVYLALQRGRFCELISSFLGLIPGEQFLIGMLSTVDAILQTPMERVLDMLPMRAEASEALLGAITDVGRPLRLLRLYETKHWSKIIEVSRNLAMAEDQLTDLYVSSSQWASMRLKASA